MVDYSENRLYHFIIMQFGEQGNVFSTADTGHRFMCTYMYIYIHMIIPVRALKLGLTGMYMGVWHGNMIYD